MPAGDREDVFALFAPNIVDTLLDRENFIDIVGEFYESLAKRYECAISVSHRRLGDAHDFWLADIPRTLSWGSDPSTVELDHFKHASIISFWLRRQIPINDIWFGSGNVATKVRGGDELFRATQKQADFSRYGSELCALYVGLYICLAYEIQAIRVKAEDREGSGDKILLMEAEIKRIRLPSQFKSEYPMIMKHKNLSTHAMYMLYRSLFANIGWGK